MAESYFIFKGRDSRSMGVISAGAAPIMRGEERVEHVTIPGRAGELTQTEGDGIFNGYIQTVTISVKGAAHVREVMDWLTGEGYVTFSGERDRRQKSRIIGAVTLNKHAYNIDWWVGEVQFYCQPFKEKMQDTAVEITTSGSMVLNGGDVTSFPRIVATASGTSMTVAAGGKTLTVTGLTSGTKYVIDSDIMAVTLANGTGALTKNSSGDFPALVPGPNTVTGSGWSKLVIDRRERFL